MKFPNYITLNNLIVLKSNITRYDVPDLIFYEELFNVNVSYDDDIGEYLRCRDCTSTYLIEKYIRKIVKNFKQYHEKFKNSSNDKYCRFFKYWLYTEKNNYSIENQNKDSTHWVNCIHCVWKKLKTNYGLTNGICELDYDNYANSVINIRNNIDELCSIKDFTELESSSISYKDKCIYYNKSKEEFIIDLFKLIITISESTTLKKKDFHINNDCTLYNFYSHFQDKLCPSESADEQPTLTPRSCDKKPCSDDAYDFDNCEKCQKYQQCLEETKSRTCPQCPEPTDLRSPNNAYEYMRSHVFIPVGFSMLGIILLFILIYKFTPIGAWLNRNIQKKKNIRNNMGDGVTGRDFYNESGRPPAFLEGTPYSMPYQSSRNY
ncbi:PIR protein [Plasmodium vivax]|nr:PIR protein [Plasmodium vivax]